MLILKNNVKSILLFQYNENYSFYNVDFMTGYAEVESVDLS